jgi:hypothetical protein
MQQQSVHSFTICYNRQSEHQRPVKPRRKEVNYLTPQMQLNPNVDFVPIDENEVLLSVALYHHTKKFKMQEFFVLGSQKLTELTDKFYCLTDLIMDQVTTKSRYLFIENVFYNDHRDSNAIDYSR